MARSFTAASSMALTSTAPAVGQDSPYTFSCWFKATSYPNNTALVSCYQTSSGQLRYIGIVSTNCTCTQYDGSTVGHATIARPSTGTWNHLAGVQTSNTSRQVYLNGTAGTSDATSIVENWTPNRQFIATSTNNPGEYFDGAVMEAAIWSAALDAGEITALSKGVSPLLIRPQSLINYWPLFGNDSPEPDRSKNATNLTLANAPTKTDHNRMIYPEVGSIQVFNQTINKALSAAATAVASLGAVRVIFKALTATATSTATLSKLVILHTLSATKTAVATLSITYRKALTRLLKATTRTLNYPRSTRRIT